MTTERRLRLAEFGLWVSAASVLTVAVAGGVGYAVGRDFLSVKYALFVVGTVLFGVGSLSLQPSTPARDRQRRLSVSAPDQTHLEQRLQRVPPLRGERLRFEKRIGRPAKLFATGLVVLAVSLFMEVGFGVTV